MKSLLRWAGSKRSLLHHLRTFWPGGCARRYIEPFCGSACLFFHLEPQFAVLGDLNVELIRTMRAIQRYPARILDSLRRLPEGKSAYYRIRSVNPINLGEIDAAARFLYLNGRCFNGLYRTNSEGFFNVPYKPPSRRVVVDAESFICASRALQRATLVHSDFETTCELAERGDFVYLDPPYAVTRRRIFSEYLPQSFGASDLTRLRLALEKLDSKGATFLITYADSLEARRLLASWHMKRISTRRNIAGFTGDRRISYEILATNVISRKEK